MKFRPVLICSHNWYKHHKHHMLSLAMATSHVFIVTSFTNGHVQYMKVQDMVVSI